jgi:hypothetical protein
MSSLEWSFDSAAEVYCQDQPGDRKPSQLLLRQKMKRLDVSPEAIGHSAICALCPSMESRGPRQSWHRGGRSRYTICHGRRPAGSSPSSLSHVSRGCYPRHANLIPKRESRSVTMPTKRPFPPTEERRSQLAPESSCFLDRIVRRCDQYVDRRNGEFSAGVDRSDTTRIPDGLFARPDSSRDPKTAQLLRSRVYNVVTTNAAQYALPQA